MGSLKAISTGGYIVMMCGLAGLFLTKQLFSPSWAVILVQALAFGLFLWARVVFGKRSYHVRANPTEGGLVTFGPYRFLRHPIYTAMCLFVAASAAAHPTGWAFVFGGMMLVGAVLRIFCEEKLVRERYPEYAAYAARTWRMIPFIF